MKAFADLSTEELAALVCQTLQAAGITVTLTGGACVAIWSRGQYVSDDLDFIEEGPVSRRKLVATLRPLGFEPRGRHFVHPAARYFIEFPTGPLTVGNQRIEDVSIRQTSAGTLRLLTPSDCVKDRLAAFYYWNDRQALEQALLVARSQAIDLADIRRWSASEGHSKRFSEFKARLCR